jgi:chorismate-pyruvate lyase
MMDVPLPATAFADARTRMLLANDGSTTRLLEAVLRGPLTVIVEEQVAEDAADLPRPVRQALRLAEGESVVTRRSLLVTGDHRPVSRNLVVIAAAPHDPLYLLAADRAVPLGLALVSAGIEQRRTTLVTGRCSWQQTGPHRPAAVKTYLIATGGRPRLHLREVYNPDLFPAHLHPS